MHEFKRPKEIFDLLDRMAGADLSLPERAVLVAQYKYADKDGRNSYVSEKRLANDLRTTDKNIRNHRQKLRTKGWLVERERGKGGHDGNRSSVYEVVIPLNQEPVFRVKRKANNPAGHNQHGKNSSYVPQEDLTSNASSREEESFHLPTHQEIDVQNPSNHPVVGGEASGTSGSADADREVAAIAVVVGGGSMVGQPKSSAPTVSSSNQLTCGPGCNPREREHTANCPNDPWKANE